MTYKPRIEVRSDHTTLYEEDEVKIFNYEDYRKGMETVYTYMTSKIEPKILNSFILTVEGIMGKVELIFPKQMDAGFDDMGFCFKEYVEHLKPELIENTVEYLKVMSVDTEVIDGWIVSHLGNFKDLSDYIILVEVYSRIKGQLTEE